MNYTKGQNKNGQSYYDSTLGKNFSKISYSREGALRSIQYDCLEDLVKQAIETYGVEQLLK